MALVLPLNTSVAYLANYEEYADNFIYNVRGLKGNYIMKLVIEEWKIQIEINKM